MIERFIAIAFPLLFLMITASTLVQAASTAENVNVIGTIVDMEGSVSVTPNSPSGEQKSVSAAIGMPVHINDTVKTAAASRAFIQFIDNTKLTLSENTSVRIDNYFFNPDDSKDNKAAYSALLGAFQYVSGLIGKKENPDVHIETPVGNIGIRGTDFWAGKSLDQYGVAVYSVAVSDGQVRLKTDGGSVILHKGQGTSVRDRSSEPTPAQTWGKGEFEYIAATVRLHGSFPTDAYTKRRIIEEQESIKNGQKGGNASPSINPTNPAPGSAPVTTPNNPPVSPTPPSPASSPAHGADSGSGTENNNITQQQLDEGIREYNRTKGLPEGSRPSPEQIEDIKGMLEQLPPDSPPAKSQ
jgi:hypothetical protein